MKTTFIKLITASGIGAIAGGSMLKSKEMKWVREDDFSSSEGMPDLQEPSTATSSETIDWIAK